MKKIMSYIVLSCFLSAILLNQQYSPVNAEQNNLNYILFSTESSIKNVVVESNDDSIITFDNTEEALKITAVDKNQNGKLDNAARIILGGLGSDFEAMNINTSENPVFAMYVKSDNYFNNNTGEMKYMAGGKNWVQFKSPRSTPDGAIESQWTLITIDLSKSSSYYSDRSSQLYGTYRGIDMTFLHKSYAAKEQNFWIQWIGFFSSTEQAMDFQKKNEPKVPNSLSNDKIVYDFSNPDNMKAIVVSGNNESIISYSEELEAVQITATDKNGDGKWQNPGRFTIGGKGSYLSTRNIYSEDCPIFAMYIKAENIEDNNSAPFKYMAGSGNWVQFKSPRTTPDNSTKSDWTLITMDLSSPMSYYTDNSDKLVGIYQGFDLSLLKNTYEVKDHNFWIKWIGVFPSYASVNSYMNGGVEDEEPFDEEELPGYDYPYWDFSDINNTKTAFVAPNTDATISYDEENKALKVSVIDGNNDDQFATDTARLYLNIPGGHLTSQYPVMAISVKLKNPNARAGWIKFSCSGSDDANQEYLDMTRLEYKNNSDWQTMVIDCAADNNLKDYFYGKWKGLSLGLALDNFASEDDEFLIKWVRLFNSVEEANQYISAKHNTPHREEIDSIEDNVIPQAGSESDNKLVFFSYLFIVSLIVLLNMRTKLTKGKYVIH